MRLKFIYPNEEMFTNVRGTKMRLNCVPGQIIEIEDNLAEGLLETNKFEKIQEKAIEKKHKKEVIE